MLSPQQLAEKKKRERQKKEEEQAKKEEEQKKKDKEAQKLAGQVVDVPPSADNRAPDRADYLSEFNTRVERETRSRHQAPFYENPMNERTVRQKSQARSEAAPQELSALEIGPPRKTIPGEKPGEGGNEATLELPSVHKRSRLQLKIDPDLGQFRNQSETEEVRGNSDRLHIVMGDPGREGNQAGSAPSKGQRALELVPQVGVLAKINGGPANDLLDLEEGEGTFLNSREFKFASFFNRLKRGVSQHWRPFDEYRRRDPSGNIYGYRTRLTVLSVTLSPQGNVNHIEVTQSSGVEFLDSEAVSAFRRAEPFPNPPRGLVDSGGNITFPFGFQVEFPSSGGGLQLPF